MASETYEVPSLDFGFFYSDILEKLLAHNRINNPELTDESEFEPTIQFLRAFALVGHNNNVVADIIANESMLETAKLPESVRAHLAKIDYRMSPARPASVEVVCELSKSFTVAKNIVPSGALFSTERDVTTGATVYFEANASKSVNPTNVFTKVFAEENEVFTDFTTEANSAVSPGDDFTPWTSPDEGDALYFMHDSIMWDRIDYFATTETDAGAGIGLWEYYSGDIDKAKPDTISDQGGYLHFDVNGYVGTKNRNGTKITVKYIPNGLSEEVSVIWVGSKNVIETQGLLGQSTVDTDVNQYVIGSYWEPFQNVSSDSGVGDIVFGKDGEEITWDLPQSIDQNWQVGTVNGASGYWARFRWIVPPTSGPTMKYGTIDSGKQYVIVACSQGQTQVDSPLGSSSGAQSQSFEGTQEFFIDDGKDILTVGVTDWTRVDDFINSKPTDEHYVVDLVGDNDTPRFKFGDGERGKIPDVGVNNISAVYRYGGDNDGNVGADRVVSDKSSLSFVAQVWNPRQAIGWTPAEGSTTQSLELAKQVGPATIRSKDIAISYTDLPRLTSRFVDANGSSLYGRSFAIEESFGPKTVELVVVAKGGGLATQAQLDELSLFFNGDKLATPPVESHFVSNQKVTATNHTQKLIPIKAKVYGTGFTELQIENALKAVIDPEAKKKDGVTYEWEFGAEISISRLEHEIHAVSNKITKVEILEPSQNIGMTFRELPKTNSVTIEIVEPS